MVVLLYFIILFQLKYSKPASSLHCGLPEGSYRKLKSQEIVNGDVLKIIENVSLITCILRCKRKQGCNFVNHHETACKLIKVDSYAEYEPKQNNTAIDLTSKDKCKADEPCEDEYPCENTCNAPYYLCVAKPTTTTTTTTQAPKVCISGDDTTGWNNIAGEATVTETPKSTEASSSCSEVDFEEPNTYCSTNADFNARIVVTLPEDQYIEKIYVRGGFENRMENVLVYYWSHNKKWVFVARLPRCEHNVIDIKVTTNSIKLEGDPLGWADSNGYYLQIRMLRIYTYYDAILGHSDIDLLELFSLQN